MSDRLTLARKGSRWLLHVDGRAVEQINRRSAALPTKAAGMEALRLARRAKIRWGADHGGNCEDTGVVKAIATAQARDKARKRRAHHQAKATALIKVYVPSAADIEEMVSNVLRFLAVAPDSNDLKRATQHEETANEYETEAAVFPDDRAAYYRKWAAEHREEARKLRVKYHRAGTLEGLRETISERAEELRAQVRADWQKGHRTRAYGGHLLHYLRVIDQAAWALEHWPTLSRRVMARHSQLDGGLNSQ